MPGGSSTGCCTPAAPAPSGAARDTMPDLYLGRFYLLWLQLLRDMLMVSVKVMEERRSCYRVLEIKQNTLMLSVRGIPHPRQERAQVPWKADKSFGFLHFTVFTR